MSPRVLTLGEVMLRLSVPSGRRLEHVHRLDVCPAGSEANVAVALAQIGVEVAWYSRLPTNALGQRVANEMIRSGVDLSLVTWVAEGRIGTFFVELADIPRPISIIYDRANSTASQMTAVDFPWDSLASAQLVHVSGITPAISSTCRELAAEVVERTAELDARVSIDVNFRPKLWDAIEARTWFSALSGKVDLLIVNHEDARDVFGITGNSDAVVQRLQDEMATPTVVLSMGAGGAIWTSGAVSHHVPAREATVIDRIGAGDAFAAGVIAGFIDGDVGRGVDMGSVMASLKLGLHGDFLTTSLEEVTSLIEAPGRTIDR